MVCAALSGGSNHLARSEKTAVASASGLAVFESIEKSSAAFATSDIQVVVRLNRCFSDRRTDQAASGALPVLKRTSNDFSAAIWIAGLSKGQESRKNGRSRQTRTDTRNRRTQMTPQPEHGVRLCSKAPVFQLSVPAGLQSPERRSTMYSDMFNEDRETSGHTRG